MPGLLKPRSAGRIDYLHLLARVVRCSLGASASAAPSLSHRNSFGPSTGLWRRRECQFPHFLFIASGYSEGRVVTDDATAHDLNPGDVVDIPPGHERVGLWLTSRWSFMTSPDHVVAKTTWAGRAHPHNPPFHGHRGLDSPRPPPGPTLAGRYILASYFMTTPPAARPLSWSHDRNHRRWSSGQFRQSGSAISLRPKLVNAFESLELQLRRVHTGEVEVSSDNVRG